MKIFILSLSIFALLFAGAVFAQELETSLDAIVEAETITPEDLGVQEPGLLPTSPFYFFKEIGRGLQRALTFGGVAKAELELKIASEKAAEAKKVADLHPDDTKGISRALLNYERAQERLQQRLKLLKDTAENPNVDSLLDKVAQRAVVHVKLLEGLEAKHDTQRDIIQDVHARVQGTLGEVAKKDTEERFHERLQNALENGPGSTLKHIRSIELLDRLRESDEFSDTVKDRLEKLRADLSIEARDSIEGFAKEGKEGVERLKDALSRIPGNTLKRSVILEEIRARASDRAANALDEARDSLDRNIQDGEDFTETVRERIGYTEERIVRIEQRLEELGNEAPQAALTLLDSAKRHLKEARAALEEGNTRNAFGLSRAADAIVSNILHVLEVGMDAVRDVTELLDRVRTRIQAIPTVLRPTSDRPTDDTIACTQEYNPVCGIDGKTYGNRCVATQQNKVRVAHAGKCAESVPPARDCLLNPSSDFLEECDAKGGVVGLRISEGERCPVQTCVVQDLLPTPPPTDVEDPASVTPLLGEHPLPDELRYEQFTIEADDSGFSPSEIRIKKGAKVTVTFNVSSSNVYFAGLDFRSSKFDTGSISPGDSVTVEFTADESFEFKSYWPSSGVLKAIGRVVVE